MSRQVAAMLLVLASVAAACGDSSPPLAEASTDRLELEVIVAPDPLVSGESATFELHVTNVSDEPALLTFDTTQRGDVALATEEVEVYRWAERRAFAQQQIEQPLAPAERVTFPLEQPDLPVAPGEYELLATVTGEPKLRTIRQPVSIVAPQPAGASSPDLAFAGALLAVHAEVLSVAIDRRVAADRMWPADLGTNGVPDPTAATEAHVSSEPRRHRTEVRRADASVTQVPARRPTTLVPA